MWPHLLRLLSPFATTLLFPVLVLEGRRARRRIPRLPDAAGPEASVVPGAGEPIRLLVLGESTVAGVGAPDQDRALAGQLAAALARRTARAVRWRAVGRNGATARTASERLVPRLDGEGADVVVLALGVNDVLHLRRPGAWMRDLARLVAALRDRLGPVPVLIAPVPPLECFPALPRTLRTVLGLRARALDHASARWAARTPGVAHTALAMRPGPELFCDDGVHPSPSGYAAIAEGLTPPLVRLLNDGGGVTVDDEWKNRSTWDRSFGGRRRRRWNFLQGRS